MSNGQTLSTSLLFEEETPKHLSSDMIGSWLRLGVSSSHGLRNLEREHAPKVTLTLSSFALGGEPSGVRTLSYQVESSEKSSSPIHMKVWYDPAASRILKREVQSHARQFTEIYSECVLDSEIPEETFRVSRR